MEQLDITQLQALVQPFVQYFSALIASGVAASVAVQLLKLDWFPLAASRFPRTTNALVSIVSALVAVYLSGVSFVFNGLLDYVGFTVGTLIVSAITYRTVLKGTTVKDGLTSQE